MQKCKEIPVSAVEMWEETVGSRDAEMQLYKHLLEKIRKLILEKGEEYVINIINDDCKSEKIIDIIKQRK